MSQTVLVQTGYTHKLRWTWMFYGMKRGICCSTLKLKPRCTPDILRDVALLMWLKIQFNIDLTFTSQLGTSICLKNVSF